MVSFVEYVVCGYLYGNCGYCYFDGGVLVLLCLVLDVGGVFLFVDLVLIFRWVGMCNFYV